MSRLNKELGNLIQLFGELKWEKICLAGGLISRLLDYKYIPNGNSNIDVFIYDYDINKLREHMIYVYKRITQYYEKTYCFIYKGSLIINILTQELSRPIQLIGVLYGDPKNIITNFDLSHCQVAWNGCNMIFTDSFVESKLKRITRIQHNQLKDNNKNIPISIHAYRLVKSYLDGYSIVKPDNNVSIKNYFDQNPIQYNDIKVPTTDKIRSFENLDIKELIDNKIVQKNLTKNYAPDPLDDDDIIYKKIKKYYSDDNNESNIIIISNIEKLKKIITHCDTLPVIF